MSLTVPLAELPEQLSLLDAVNLAYPDTLSALSTAVQRGLSSLVECAKDLTPFVFINLRCACKRWGFNASISTADRKPRSVSIPSRGPMAQMMNALRETVRGPVERRVVVLPHLDLMTSLATGLSNDARDVITLLQENPELIWIGFRDPLVPMPPLLEEIAALRLQLGGIALARLGKLITRREARKFGSPLDLGALHWQVSGLNAVRLRRFLSAFDREDLPADPQGARVQLRRLTLAGRYAIPDETFESIPGHEHVKKHLRADVVAFVDRIGRAETLAEREGLDSLLPRGLLLAGPARAVQQLLARALANAIGAVLLETSGAELKSRYVGGSEENLRLLFRQARQAAPAVILFKDLDRLSDASQGVDRSILQQLQQELDRLPSGELVLVIATAATTDTLEPDLFRPGRLELTLTVNHSDLEERRRLLTALDEELKLQLTPAAGEQVLQALAAGVREDDPIGADVRLRLLCRGLARFRLREGREGATDTTDVEQLIRSRGYANEETPAVHDESEAGAIERGSSAWGFWKKRS